MSLETSDGAEGAVIGDDAADAFFSQAECDSNTRTDGVTSDADGGLSVTEAPSPSLVARRRALRRWVGCIVVVFATFGVVAIRKDRARRGFDRALQNVSSSEAAASLIVPS